MANLVPTNEWENWCGRRGKRGGWMKGDDRKLASANGSSDLLDICSIKENLESLLRANAKCESLLPHFVVAVIYNLHRPRTIKMLVVTKIAFHIVKLLVYARALPRCFSLSVTDMNLIPRGTVWKHQPRGGQSLQTQQAHHKTDNS
jgi:hypothetical protein